MTAKDLDDINVHVLAAVYTAMIRGKAKVHAAREARGAHSPPLGKAAAMDVKVFFEEMERKHV